MAKRQSKKLFLYPVEIEPAEEGGFFASCPSLPGCHAEGETYSETIENIEDVIKAHLELRKKHGETVSNVLLNDRQSVTVNLPILIQT
jgi:predicted RNase H-like HicB family nuclease